MKLKTFLQEAALQRKGVSETPSLDAQVLAAHCLNTTRSWILAHLDADLSPPILEELYAKFKQLQEGVPLPYLIGKWEFYGHEFRVTPQVLIPRPETEVLVDLALRWLNRKTPSKTVLDIGTGSGCIAISIALHSPSAQLYASDISLPALRVAQENILLYKLNNRIHLICAADIPPIKTSFDLICANLPYISSRNLLSLPVARSEPHLALDGGEDGLEIYRRIIPAMRSRLNPDSLILFEIDPQQVQPLMEFSTLIFPDSHLHCFNDLSGMQRVLAIQPFSHQASLSIEESLCS